MKTQLYKLIERQLEASRLEASVRNEFLDKLETLFNQTNGVFSQYDFDNLSKKDQAIILSTVKAVAKDVYADIRTLMSGFTIDMVTNERAFIESLVDAQDELSGLSMLTPVFGGLTADEWLDKQENDFTIDIKKATRTGGDILRLRDTYRNRGVALTQTWQTATQTAAREQAIKKIKTIQGYWHVSVLDGKTSDICLVRSNLRWDKDKKPIDHNLPFMLPPLHPHCRSFVGFVMDVTEEPAGQSVEDWLDSKTESQLNEILGTGRAELYRSGLIQLRELLDQSGRPVTFKELTEKLSN